MMSKRKRNVKTDRLSELPDSLIFDIFGSLPMTDVVQTTLLSKRWKNLWTTAPCLHFCESKMTNTDKIRNLVNGSIHSWRGTRIISFHVQFDSKLDSKSLESDVDLWMHFATEKKVEELVLYLPYRNNRSEAKLVLLPQCIYSCSSLKDLRLSSCDLQIHGNVQWCQLNNLEIDVECLSAETLDQVLSGSPQLEYFTLSVCGNKESLSIRSTSLRWLCILNLLFHVEDLTPMETEVRIWTPNLETIELKGVPFSKCLLMKVPSLIEACLLIDDPGLYGADFVGEAMLNQVLPSIRHVSIVRLSNWCIKVLGGAKEKHIYSSPFPYAELLELKVCCEEYEEIVDIVRMFPILRDLVIETSYKSAPKLHVSCFNYDVNLWRSFFPWQLRTVDITWTVGDESIFPLMEILLKYARKLKMMVLRRDKRIKTRTPSKSLIMVSQKLLRLQRSFPAVELSLC